MKQHGFARVCTWTLVQNKGDSAEWSLTEKELSEEWREAFPFKFRLEYAVEVTESKHLRTKLSITNKEEEESFDFTVLFHSYFRAKAKAVRVGGLKGLEFVDKLEENDMLKQEDREQVGIECEVDRIYLDIKDEDIVLVDTAKQQYPKVTIKRTGFVDVVLWNPWIEKAKRMSDFEDQEFENMVCIEPGSVTKPVLLKHGEFKVYTQTLIASAL